MRQGRRAGAYPALPLSVARGTFASPRTSPLSVRVAKPKGMSGRSDLEATFLQNLPVIDRATAQVARRHGFMPDDTAELTSWVKLRIIEDDYAALRKFRGESSISTYLTVVVAMLVRDYCAQKWGRWRPSACARRLGEVATRLETLVHRNGLPLQQAGELLRTSGLTTSSDLQLSELLARMPTRRPLRPSPGSSCGSSSPTRSARSSSTCRSSEARGATRCGTRSISRAAATSRPTRRSGTRGRRTARSAQTLS